MSKYPGSKDLAREKSSSSVQVIAAKDVDVEVPKQRSTLQSVLLVATCTLAMMTNTSNSISIAIALPVMETELNIPQVQLQWVVSAYSLSSGCLLVLFGRLADLYGKRRMYILGSAWLVAFTLGCAFAPNALTLDILRGLQGVGASATIPAAIGTLAEAFPSPRARAIAFSTFSAGAPLGATLGTVIGGILTQVTPATWKASFYLNCVLQFISVIGALISFEKDKPSHDSDRRVDWLGALLVTAGLTLIVFVLGQGEVASQKWATPYIIGSLVAGVVLVLIFGLWQHYLEHVHDGLRDPYDWIPSPPPLMRLSFWKRSKGRVTVVMIIAFLNWASFLGWNFWTVLYYQNFVGFGPIQTVLRLLPMFVVGIFCNIIVASFVGRWPLVVLIAAGTGLTGAASLFFAIINPDAPYWAYGFPSACLSVFGADFVFASGTLFIAHVSAQYEQSVAGAVFQEMTQIGSSAGVTVSTVVFNRVLSQLAASRGLEVTDASGRNLPRDVQLRAYQAAAWTNFALGMAATLLAVAFLSSVGIIGHTEKAPDPDPAAVVVKDDDSKYDERRTVLASYSSLQTRPNSILKTPITFPWSQLRELELASCDIHTALGILINSANNLVHCHFGEIGTSPIPVDTRSMMSSESNMDLPLPYSKSTIIAMPQLRTFSLHLSEAGPQLLDYLVLTSLNDLTLLGLESTRAVDHVISLIIRSACCVKRLKLFKFPMMDHTLIRLFRQMPELDMLEMRGWVWNDLWRNMTRGTGARMPMLNPVLPHLKSFKLILGGSEEFRMTDPDGEASRLRQVFLWFPEHGHNHPPVYSLNRNSSWREVGREGSGGITVDVRNARKPLILDNKPIIQNTRAAADMVKNWGAALTDTLLGKRDIDAENAGIIDEVLTEIEWYNRTTERFLGSSIIRKTLRDISLKETIARDAEFDLKRRARSLAKNLK
ncbi:hypothetical protein D9758_010586 [Tetrapyrgos nigripes]|uniref:Major facilitator superfamily (MFS) profile domain-containing protein n=1 Tax=Tetrapyrgos nigripes TaxID=182062 RepID=A0A8H5FYN5_9AGAR|nr:hypothetical protein D9758_010586 [Tetrapyrgos nigripes]